MKVKLLTYTRLPAELIASAGKSCYSTKPSSEIMDTITPEQVGKQLGIIHGSVFEHAVFTFSIEGISRVTTHQLVRHRVASFSQQSMRYVDVHKLWDHIIIPPKVQEVMDDENELADSLKDEYMLNAIENYKYALSQLMSELDKHGIPSEDVRYFVPHGVQSNITMTMNVRELQHFLGLRRCTRAQWEIRELADKIANILVKEVPELFTLDIVGPQCIQTGYCPEEKGCGRMPKSTKVVINGSIFGKYKGELQK